MASYLYRLGKAAFRGRKFVLALWLAVLLAAGVGAAALSGPTSNSFSIPGTEAQRALDLLKTRMPEASADGATARVVFQAPHGQKVAKEPVEKVVRELNKLDDVASVTDPFEAELVSPDGSIAFAQVAYKVQGVELEHADRDALVGATQVAKDAGLTVEVGGDAMQEPAGVSATEAIGVGVAALVLAMTFGSLVAAGLPLLNALIGVGIAMAAIMAASGFTKIGSTTPILALMLGLAVAIDYTLFIVSRYRKELQDGREPEEAAGRALGTAGSAVVFAGLTVVIALAGLAVAGIPTLTEMGLAASFAVTVAMLVALTLGPALLGFAGRRVLGKSAERKANPNPLSRRWATAITRRPLAALLAATALLGVVALPALDLRLGISGDEALSTERTERRAYELLEEGFGPGFNGPLLLVVDSPDAAATADGFAREVSSFDGVAAVTAPTPNTSGDTAVFTVVPKSGPSEQATTDLVEHLRDTAPNGTMVTGNTAVGIDISAKLGSALAPYLALIVGLALVLLLLVFRSILVPLKAALGFLLTMAATFGAVVAVFQWGWLSDLFGVPVAGPIQSLTPIFLVGVVFGLAMDYQVFLVTPMREEYVNGASPKRAVEAGFQHGARVVTAAAVIMIAVFAGFLFSHDPMIKLMGFAMAAGVFFDAFVVRMTIVPAVLALLGRRAWSLPQWLDRVLPDMDVEGAKLDADVDERKPAHV
ncbi:MMPL family transporter [Streptomyces sp. CA-210063]|uniref:MMPL family transporter n=1 Tax=Streptomyces sp. CA-210063 TaxID=2801029 RepID=UPI00214B3724|nr:MMPL family transporter [Streptomyces sp. CA-210063]UUU28465.1 MMPL family transporter [Streptomyces sp. CA-210063]